MLKHLKGAVKSWTINWGLLLTIGGFLYEKLPLIQDKLGDHYGTVLIVIGAVNIVLRFKTTKAVHEK